MSFQIAIDGPAGSGKSTVAKKVAKQLGFIYVDTGAMYRAVGLYCDNRNINVKDALAVSAALCDINIEIKQLNQQQHVFLNGEDVTPSLRTPRAGMAAAAVAAHSKVRERLVALQRQLAKTANVVMDGRDICAYVLPNANVKIYLDASVDARVTRRCNELKKLNAEYDCKRIKDQIIERDIADRSRKIAPLAIADGAIVIDSSNMNINEVVEAIIAIC